jgi:hypothetical protein
MATAQTIVEAALRNIGAIAIEEPISGAEAADALNLLNNMIATWNTENLMIYSVTPEVFPVVANQASYTMGPGGNFNTTRPVLIENAYMRDSAGNDYQMSIVNYDVYSAIISKYTSSALPTVMYDNGDFPLKTITFWPIASDASYSFVLWSWKAITNLPLLTTAISLPPGYQSALEFNLAVWLCPRYGKTCPPELAALASSTKAQIKKINYEVKELTFDPTLTKRGRVFNWLTGM